MVRVKRNAEGEFWADKFMDLANLEVVVLVFSQFVASQISWKGMGGGILIF